MRRNSGLWALIGVMLTSLYTFRMIFVVFFGEAHKRGNQEARLRHAHSVFRAGILTMVDGYFKAPFGRFLETVAALDRSGRTRFR